MQSVVRGIRPLWIPGPVQTALLGLVGIVGLYLALFTHRSDYAAHTAAGFGLVLVGFVLVGLVTPTSPYLAVVVVMVTWAVVVVAEMTVTGPEFDPVDVSNSMLGAVLAGATLLERPADRSELPALGALAALALALAFGLRYGSAALG